MSQTLQSVLCITTNKYLVRVLVVLLHARFSVVGPMPFLLAAIFFSVHPYIGSTTVLPDIAYLACIVAWMAPGQASILHRINRAIFHLALQRSWFSMHLITNEAA